MNNVSRTGLQEEFFHGPGIEALLRCGDDGCTLDVSLCGSLIDRQRPHAILEVFLQPLDDHTRLPRGWPVSLLHQPLDLVYLPRPDRAVGRSRLPGVQPALAPNCYYRVTPLRNPDHEHEFEYERASEGDQSLADG